MPWLSTRLPCRKGSMSLGIQSVDQFHNIHLISLWWLYRLVWAASVTNWLVEAIYYQRQYSYSQLLCILLVDTVAAQTFVGKILPKWHSFPSLRFECCWAYTQNIQECVCGSSSEWRPCPCCEPDFGYTLNQHFRPSRINSIEDWLILRSFYSIEIFRWLPSLKL